MFKDTLPDYYQVTVYKQILKKIVFPKDIGRYRTNFPAIPPSYMETADYRAVFVILNEGSACYVLLYLFSV